MAIIVHNLSKHYGTQRAVDNISFNIQKGEIVGFLGPNGAGKSTTMKMLTTYITPTGGTATVVDYDIVGQSSDVKKKIGYLGENNPLYYDMFVREYLTLAGRMHQLSDVSNRVEEVIRLTGLDKEAHKKIGQLSKGYKQRVGIAQAIIHDPEVLILDEPTSGLDPNQLDDIRKLIVSIGRDKAVMLSTHIMQEVEAICDRVLIINNGKIVKEQTLQGKVIDSLSRQVVITFNISSDRDDFLKILPKGATWQSVDELGLIIDINEQLSKQMLLKTAVSHNIEIASMEDYHPSMEDVFRKATK